MLYYLLTSLYVFVCLVLLLVILLQQGKGGDMASAFGGGSSQTAFGARGGATVLAKLTAAFAALFMIGALALDRRRRTRQRLGGERHARAGRTGTGHGARFDAGDAGRFDTSTRKQHSGAAGTRSCVDPHRPRSSSFVVSGA